MMDSDGFSVVHRKKKNGQTRNTKQTMKGFTRNADNEVDIFQMKGRIEKIIIELRITPFYSNFRDSLTRSLKSDVIDGQDGDGSADFVCYGVGNFASCLIARYQLAAFLCLRNDYQILSSECFIYDPKFTSSEISILNEFELQVLTKNEEGKRSCNAPTVFFMPHCGKALYNNLLWKNWTSALSNLVIIGNSFKHMVDSIPERILTQQAWYIHRIFPYIKEIPLENSFQYDDIFNDISIHVFPSCILTSLPPDFWNDCPEPQYNKQDMEIITNK